MINRYFHPLSLTDCLDRLKKNRLPSRGVVLTFDDGYANNYLTALPLLAAYKIPATFFITTGMTGSSREFWWDELEQVIFQAPRPALEQSIHLTGLAPILKKDSPRQDIYYELWKQIHSFPIEKIHGIIRQLAVDTGQKIKLRPSHRPMTREELLALAEFSVSTIGAHTLQHPNLKLIDPLKQEREILGSKDYLEELHGRKIDHFSYPFGSFGISTPEIVRACGFKSACTTEHRLLKSSEDSLLLPRLQVGNWNGRKFRSRLVRQFSNP